ncbi:hypothetical protein F7725_022871 [Dissostichus mawsoni]|uniref:Uncharacterized protein n=1 Tax=Dissostichus mawsoni TaxID=36200 RepID=A0A7J5YZG8_DISMA|nr:hypothetical protein F7725_022871 [Dissostichus mawsoni]
MQLTEPILLSPSTPLHSTSSHYTPFPCSFFPILLAPTLAVIRMQGAVWTIPLKSALAEQHPYRLSEDSAARKHLLRTESCILQRRRRGCHWISKITPSREGGMMFWQGFPHTHTRDSMCPIIRRRGSRSGAVQGLKTGFQRLQMCQTTPCNENYKGSRCEQFQLFSSSTKAGEAGLIAAVVLVVFLISVVIAVVIYYTRNAVPLSPTDCMLAMMVTTTPFGRGVVCPWCSSFSSLGSTRRTLLAPTAPPFLHYQPALSIQSIFVPAGLCPVSWCPQIYSSIRFEEAREQALSVFQVGRLVAEEQSVTEQQQVPHGGQETTSCPLAPTCTPDMSTIHRDPHHQAWSPDLILGDRQTDRQKH